VNDDITSEQAHEALGVADEARRRVAAEIGLPRAYWWAMAAGWLVLGVLGDLGPVWLATVATLGFGIGHATVAARVLNGRRQSDRLQVSAAVAGRRTPLIVVVMLLGLVALTVAAGMALNAEGAAHPGIWAALIVAVLTGFGGPQILQVLRHWARA
jgi:hypothetical protein